MNLLIAVMNSTYEKNQAVSQTQWAYNRVVAPVGRAIRMTHLPTTSKHQQAEVEAVLEFDHESILPLGRHSKHTESAFPAVSGTGFQEI